MEGKFDEFTLSAPHREEMEEQPEKTRDKTNDSDDSFLLAISALWKMTRESQIFCRGRIGEMRRRTATKGINRGKRKRRREKDEKAEDAEEGEGCIWGILLKYFSLSIHNHTCMGNVASLKHIDHNL